MMSRLDPQLSLLDAYEPSSERNLPALEQPAGTRAPPGIRAEEVEQEVWQEKFRGREEGKDEGKDVDTCSIAGVSRIQRELFEAGLKSASAWWARKGVKYP